MAARLRAAFVLAAREPGAFLFDDWAREQFALQFESNAAYRKFCERRGVTPAYLTSWRDIPAVPTEGFKELELTSIPAAERTTWFESSGTTGQIRSRHFHHAESLATYEAALLAWFEKCALPKADAKIGSTLLLTPTSSLAPHSSLVHMFETINRELFPNALNGLGEIDPTGAWTLPLAAVREQLLAVIEAKTSVLLAGTAFGFVHLCDGLEGTGEVLALPQGSMVLETGGYKGRSRELPKAELHAMISRKLGVSRERIVCEYGMSELSSQAYDCADGISRDRVFHFPPWVRTQIISPETGREAKPGEPGLLRIHDLANVWSVAALQTGDMAVQRGTGFEMLGRLNELEPRGCSLASVA